MERSLCLFPFRKKKTGGNCSSEDGSLQALYDVNNKGDMSGDVGVEHFAFLLFLLPHIYPVLIGGAAQTRARAFPVSLCYSGTIDLGCERGLGEFCESTDGSSSKLGVIQRKSIVQAESSSLSLSFLFLCPVQYISYWKRSSQLSSL